MVVQAMGGAIMVAHGVSEFPPPDKSGDVSRRYRRGAPLPQSESRTALFDRRRPPVKAAKIDVAMLGLPGLQFLRTR